jgi:multiple sugar transport system permease protein
METEQQTQNPAQPETDLETTVPVVSHHFQRLGTRAERLSRHAFVWPAILVVLLLSIFPLLISLYFSLSRLKFVKGGYELNFVGLANYRKLLAGSEKTHFLGKLAAPSLFGWLVLAIAVMLLVWFLVRYVRSQAFSGMGLFWRVVMVAGIGLLAWLVVQTVFSSDGRPGTLVVTLIYVFVGIVIQYFLGLGLAVLTTQHLPGRRFFRVVFLLPMMITPVGVAYTFRMMTDTDKGPFQPIWQALGLGLYSWVNDPWGARTAVLISDIWQWTPFMFIVLLAALESQSIEQVEAAIVDGANRWQIFWRITWPQILPVSLTVVLIRMIEAFKIVDLPQVMTSGGPGTATESLTLHSFISWRTLDLGGSAAIAYMLLFVVTFIGISYVNLLRGRAVEA